MKKTVICCMLVWVFFVGAALAQTVTLSNGFLSRTLTVSDGVLRTTRIENRRAGTEWCPENAAEFRLRVSQGTQFAEGDEILSTSDFVCTKAEPYTLDGAAGSGAAFTLENREKGLTVTVRYELREADFFLRKRLEIWSERPITLEYIEVDSVPAPDALQIYQCSAMTAQAPGNWRPNLGQPLYTTQTGTFWGDEYPAVQNTVENQVQQYGDL